MKERRREKRITVPNLATIIGEKKTIKGAVKDINSIGARLLTPVPLQTGEAIKIKIELPKGEGEIITMAKVVWQEQFEDSYFNFRSGVIFINPIRSEIAKVEVFGDRFEEIPARIFIKIRSILSNLGGDLFGGSTATILALPEAMAYGVIVFAPLGSEYASLGVLAGLVALCFSNLGASFCGGVRIMNNGPYSLTSLMLASALTIITARVSDGNISTIIGLLFLVVFMSGLFQILFGVFKAGEMVKYIPYPVTSGLLNGTAILIFLGQIPTMFGLLEVSPFLALQSIQPLTLFVGIITVATIFIAPKLTKKIPPPFQGIAIGTLVYYGLVLLGFKESLGEIIGNIPFAIPAPTYILGFGEQIFSRRAFMIITELTPLAFSIAVVASLQSLLTTLSADNILRERSHTNRELIGQGMGNILSSFYGGIICAGSPSRTMANYTYGGRTAKSRIASGVFALIILLFIGPLISVLPKVVLAGTLIVLAIRGFDPWAFNLVSSLFSKEARLKHALSDLSIVVVVAAILVTVGVFQAVGFGIFISVVFFVLRMGKDIIRRQYNAKRIRSNVQRPIEEINYLEEHGARIRVFELEGSLFFGTADRIAKAIDEVIKIDVDYIIVDLLHISDIDSTGVNILTRIGDRCRDKEKHFLLSSIKLTKCSDDLMAELSFYDGIANIVYPRYFETIDDALAWSEDQMLDEKFGVDRYDKGLPLEKFELLKEFSETDLESLNHYFEKANYDIGQEIFKQGISGDKVYLLSKGKVRIVIDIPDGKESRNIARLCPGTIFGEMSIVDKGIRSASAIAETRVTCYELGQAESVRLNKEHPELGHKLLIGFAKELSKRVRIANRITTELKI